MISSIFVNMLIGLFAAVVNPRPQEGHGEFIPLRDGEILVGEISSHNEDGLEIKRLDNGGIVNLRWGQLAPPFEKKLKTNFGYIFEEQDEITVPADEITLRDGTKRVGKILTQSNDQIVLKDSKSTLTYERSTVVGAPVQVTAPALEIYTKDELYTEQVSTVDLATPEGNMTLARYLEQINDFTRAIQHWNEVKKLDANFHPTDVSKSLARLEEKKARQEEIDYLLEIERARARKQYDKGILLCDEFPKKFVKSAASTRADVEKRKKNIEAARHAERVHRVWVEYHRQAELLCRNKAGDRKLTLDAAKSWSNSELAKEIIAAAVPVLQKNWKELNDAEFVKFWKERGKLSKRRSASYGLGTFILGAAGARKGINMSVPASKTTSQEDAMLKKMQELIKKAQSGAAGAPQQQKLDPPEEWWQRQAQVFERYQFLLANFAEFGREMEDLVFTPRNCMGCNGAGVINILNTGGQTPGGVTTGGGGRSAAPAAAPTGASTAECPSCRGAGIQRVVSYR
ncbi:MAG: hypothetical protein ACKVS6_14805 [Planctomycetota bacterium]